MFRIALCLIAAFYPSLASADGVVASIKPVHSLVAAVMQGDARQPEVLLSGSQSLHSLSLRPSQAKMLADAQVVFYISDRFELFMDKALTGAPKTLRRVALDAAPGLTLLPARMSQGFEPHQHEHHDHEDGHAAHHDNAALSDLHLWMSPANAKLMVQTIARELSALYPDKQALYQHNAAALLKKLDELDSALAARMKKLQGRPFIVFHDATQYFEARYGLSAAGSITVHPERGLSAGHVAAIRKKVSDAQVLCVFREPQFEDQIIHNLLEGTKARSVMIDPEGALLEPGAALYFQLIEAVAAGFESCLAA